MSEIVLFVVGLVITLIAFFGFRVLIRAAIADGRENSKRKMNT